uniref:Uncharacterized protein n=1 Tax=Romanomermis culicivorax TaxID=13658 RepID=A0A915JSE0_ROMCU
MLVKSENDKDITAVEIVYKRFYNEFSFKNYQETCMPKRQIREATRKISAQFKNQPKIQSLTAEEIASNIYVYVTG